MALKQTRRTVSLSRATYDAAVQAAAREGISAAEWVTRLIREALAARHEVRLDLVTGDSFDRGETCSRADLDRMAAERKLRANGVKPGTYCRNCIDNLATHRGHVDNTGTVYDLCDACELPAESKYGPERGYEPSGGFLTAAEVRAAGKAAVGADRWERDTRQILQEQRGPSAALTDDERAIYGFERESHRIIERDRNTWAPNGRRR